MLFPEKLQTSGVAVILRTRDRPQFLPRALQSLLDQDASCRDWGVVIVNQGDRASVEQSCAPFAAALTGRAAIVDVSSAPGLLMGALTNAGIRASQSRWITVLDDDDTWHPEFLNRVLARLTHGRRHPDVRGVATQSLTVEDLLQDGRLATGQRAPFNPTFRKLELFALAAANLFTGNAFVYEREALETVGFYAENLPVLDDWDFNLRFAAAFEIDVIPEPLAHYHRREASSFNPGAAHSPMELHEFYHAKIINDRLRNDLRNGTCGTGLMMAMASKLRQQSDKIGKIDSRTRELLKQSSLR